MSVRDMEEIEELRTRVVRAAVRACDRGAMTSERIVDVYVAGLYSGALVFGRGTSTQAQAIRHIQDIIERLEALEGAEP
jgi:hypothetical protein